MSLAERIDRKVFLELWTGGSLRMRAFLRVFYRDAYPHWPEMQDAAQAQT